jgi:trehalose 6-phosphate synthase/phosphatase
MRDRLLIVSNRLPITLRVEREQVVVEPSAGGLVAALRSAHDPARSLWIGWAGESVPLTPAQQAAVDRELEEQRVVAIPLSADEVRHYYDGFSNAVLWPLFHYLLDKVHLDARRDWEVYRSVNERFAEHIARVYRPGDVVWVHDYQLALVPQMLRARIPDARIGFFLHIPFPSSEVFRLLPWREAILRGLLGADLIGFHTASYRHNFAFSAARVIGLEPDVDEIVHDGRRIRLGVHPIGIDAGIIADLASNPNVQRDAEQIRGASAAETIALGVDRLDYTKGIPRRFLAIERYLESRGDRGKNFRYIQLAVPTRERVDAYSDFRRAVHELVGRINGQHASVAGAPINFLHRSVTPRELVALYRAADVMLVTPLRDGMNLVAKEYVASRLDETGVLILSEFAGAADEMGDALLVNPYDIDSVAHALTRATTMPFEEQRKRMRTLRKSVLDNDVHAWARGFLSALHNDRSPRATAPPPELAIPRDKDLTLFLDYDGTLAEFSASPARTGADEEIRVLLERLAARPGTTVHLVSERAAEDLDRLIGELPIHRHAEHGALSRPPHGTWAPGRLVAPAWQPEALAALTAFAERTPGAVVEQKTTTIAWHYRMADPELALVELLRRHDLEWVAGAKVLELRPRGVDKGSVVRAHANASTVIVMGDDRSDEDMFAAVSASAYSIRIGDGPTSARYRLATPSDARRFLLRICEDRGTTQ